MQKNSNPTPGNARTGGVPRYRAVNISTSYGRRLLAIISPLVLLLAAGCQPAEPPWNVLVVTFDTTRADRIGCYGFDGVKTPTVDGLAAQGVRFERAMSTVPITLPSHSSIFTGLYPNAHGVRDNGQFALPDEQLTLAEILRDEGYATAAAIGSFPLVARFGLDQGFDLYDDHVTGSYEGVDGQRTVPKNRLFFDERKAELVNEAALPWLDEHHQQPFFLWIHYYDPHQPLEPPPPYDDLYANDLYAGEIAYSDESLGVLIEHLRRLGVEDRTLIVFTSDHGEGLGEHGETTHSYLLYSTTLHVPLIVRPPDGPQGVVVSERVRTVDIMPTVLELLDLPVPSGLQGRSLVSLWNDGGADGAPRPHYAETLAPRLVNGWGELRAFFDGRWKYIHGPRPQLFDLETDPREISDLVADQPEVASELESKLEGFLRDQSRSGTAAAIQVDDETRRRLMALGYLQAGGDSADEISEELREGGIAPRDRIGDVTALSAARDLLFKGRALAARDVLGPLLEANPDNSFYREAMALAELQLGRIPQALELAESLIEGGTHRTQGLMARIGHQLYLQGEHEDGIRRLRQGIEVEPLAESYYLLSTMLGQQGRLEEAREALDQALEQDPRYGPALVDRAVYLARGGETQAAGEAFELALAEHPYYAKAHYNHGAFLLEAGDAGTAAQRFARAVELAPDYAEAYYGGIVAQLSLGQRQIAEEILHTLARRLPRSLQTKRATQLLATEHQEASP